MLDILNTRQHKSRCENFFELPKASLLFKKLPFPYENSRWLCVCVCVCVFQYSVVELMDRGRENVLSEIKLIRLEGLMLKLKR